MIATITSTTLESVAKVNQYDYYLLIIMGFKRKMYRHHYT